MFFFPIDTLFFRRLIIHFHPVFLVIWCYRDSQKSFIPRSSQYFLTSIQLTNWYYNYLIRIVGRCLLIPLHKVLLCIPVSKNIFLIDRWEWKTTFTPIIFMVHIKYFITIGSWNFTSRFYFIFYIVNNLIDQIKNLANVNICSSHVAFHVSFFKRCCSWKVDPFVSTRYKNKMIII